MTDKLNPRMTERRLLLGLGVSATVLLPSWLRPAVAWAATRHHHRRLLAAPTAPAHVVPLIMLDPGHGGGDIGTAHNGLIEKLVTLDIARRVRALLAAQGWTVKMTRDTDIDPFNPALLPAMQTDGLPTPPTARICRRAATSRTIPTPGSS